PTLLVDGAVRERRPRRRVRELRLPVALVLLDGPREDEAVRRVDVGADAEELRVRLDRATQRRVDGRRETRADARLDVERRDREPPQPARAEAGARVVVERRVERDEP